MGNPNSSWLNRNKHFILSKSRLGIGDHEIMNMASGTKMAWEITREHKWWKEGIQAEYLQPKDRKHCLDLAPRSTRGPHI